MSLSAFTNLLYNKSSTLNDALNPDLLKQEIFDVYPTVDAVTALGTTFQVSFTALLLAADITAIDAIVAAHTGVAFGAGTTRVQEIGKTTDSTNAWIQKISLTTGPLKKGWFMVNASGEMELEDLNVPTGRVEVQVLQTDRDNTDAQVLQDTWDQDNWNSMQMSHAKYCQDGEVLTLKFQFRSRNGALVGVRRARLSVSPTFSDS